MKKTLLLTVATAFCGLGSAFAYDTLPAWTLTWTNSACTVGHLTTDAAHGGWTLHVKKDTSRHGGYGLTVAQSHLGTGSGVVAGEGELDLRGTITGPVTTGGADTTAWKIGRLDTTVFRGNDSKGNATPAGKIDSLRTPGTLTTDGIQDICHTDGTPKNTMKDILIVEPELTGSIPPWIFSGCYPTNIVVQAPMLTGIGFDFCNCASPQPPSTFDDWDLSSVKTLGTGSTDGNGAFRGWEKMPGTVRLPSLVSAWTRSFWNCKVMGGALLGTKGTLKTIGKDAFLGCNALTNVVIGASPVGSTLTLGTNAFAAANLRRVWFNGNPPAFSKASGSYTFGTSATVEGQITFYVRDTPEWATVLAEADADPDRLVAATVFETAQRQRVERFPGFRHLDDVSGITLFDPNFATKYDERITVTGSEFPYTADGLFAYPLTVTASCSAEADAQGRKAAFYRWDGVPRSRETANPLVLNADETQGSIRAFFAHDWVYDDSNAITNTIDNGVWKINVSVYDATKKQLRVGLAKGNGALSTAITGTGSGALDFNGTIRGAGGETWEIVVFTAYSMTKLKNWDDNTAADFKALPTAIVYPETLRYGCSDSYNFNQTRAWPLEEIIFIAPEYTGNLSFHINGATKLKAGTVRAPKMTTISSFIYQDVWNWAADLDTWDLSGVTTISDWAFHGKTGVPFKGTLDLPNIRTIGYDNFSNFTAIAGAKLGTNLTLTAVGAGSFYNAKALKTLTIGNAKNGVTVGANAFAGTTAPSSVTFLGPRDETLADAVLTGVAASDGDKAATVCASARFRWNRSAAVPTATEESLKPAGTFGVYRTGSRKAWLVDTPSPYDPRGIVILLK